MTKRRHTLSERVSSLGQTARTGHVHQNGHPPIQPDRICPREVRRALADVGSHGFLELGHGPHFHVTSAVVTTAVSAGFNGGGRTSSDAGEGEMAAVLLMTCSLNRAGTGSRNGRPRHPSLSPPMPVPLARTFFFHVEASKGCPPQPNSSCVWFSTPAFLAFENVSKPFQYFIHKSVSFQYFYTHTKVFFVCI